MQSSSLYEIHKKGGGERPTKKIRKLITGGDIICRGDIIWNCRVCCRTSVNSYIWKYFVET